MHLYDTDESGGPAASANATGIASSFEAAARQLAATLNGRRASAGTRAQRFSPAEQQVRSKQSELDARAMASIETRPPTPCPRVYCRLESFGEQALSRLWSEHGPEAHGGDWSVELDERLSPMDWPGELHPDRGLPQVRLALPT